MKKSGIHDLISRLEIRNQKIARDIIESSRVKIDFKAYTVLKLLNQKVNGAHTEEVSGMLGLSNSSTNSYLSDLKDEGLVFISNDPEDKRKNIFLISRKGLRKFEKISAPIEKEFKKKYKNLSKEEKKILEIILKKISD